MVLECASIFIRVRPAPRPEGFAPWRFRRPGELADDHAAVVSSSCDCEFGWRELGDWGSAAGSTPRSVRTARKRRKRPQHAPSHNRRPAHAAALEQGAARSCPSRLASPNTQIPVTGSAVVVSLPLSANVSHGRADGRWSRQHESRARPYGPPCAPRRCSPNPGIAAASTVRPSDGIGERACFAEVAGMAEVLAEGPIRGDLQAHLPSLAWRSGHRAHAASLSARWP